MKTEIETNFPFYILEGSVHDMCLSVRAANLIHKMGIKTIQDLLDNCVIDSKFIGLKGDIKGVNGIGINSEIEQILHQEGFVYKISYIKKTNKQLDPPDTHKMSQIAKNCNVSLSLPLDSFEWKDDKGNDFIQNHKKLKVSDLILEFVRFSNSGKLIFCSWSGNTRGRRLIEDRLVDWGVLELSKSRVKKQDDPKL